MKIFFSFLIYYLIISISCVIPNWNLDKVGNKIINSSNDTYNFTTVYKNNDVGDENLEIQVIKELYMENNTIKNRSKVIYNNEIKIVPFDLIESFHKINDDIIICPKGNYHPYSLSNKKWMIPTNMENPDISNWDLKCKKQKSETSNGDVYFFLVFYLMHEKFYFLVLGETKWGSMGEKQDIIYDFKLEKTNHIYDKLAEYPMMTLIQRDNYLLLQGKIIVLKRESKSIYEDKADKVKLTLTKGHTQAYFDIDTNTYYFISYDDIYNFISGYYNTSNKEIKETGFSDWYPINNTVSPFEFIEEQLEIEQMNFILNNKFVYYKIKDSNNKTYYGVLDITLNKVVFNTDETLIEFIPNSKKSMLAITSSTAYEICLYKDSQGNCVEKCDNNNYILDSDGNICSYDKTCSDGKLMLVPNEICIEDCDKSIYISNDTHCGLCKDLGSNGKEYKLINGTECIELNSTSMEYYNERLKLLKCKDGFMLKDNDCVSDFKCYELCEEGQCTQVSTNISNQYCTECIKGYFLYKGNCDKNCPERHQADNSSKTCLECNVTNCTTFINNTCKCSKCDEAYFINSDNICEKCPNNCISCKNSTICEKCEKDFFVDSQGNCSHCPLENCEEKEEDNCHCKNCYNGYFKYEDKCKKCDADCQTCSMNETNCTSCEEGKFLTTEKKCKSCDKKCQTCESNANNTNDICLSCNQSSIYKYLVNDDLNKTCVENCTNVGREFNLNNNTCKAKEEKKEPSKTNTYLLIIFSIIIGIILLVIGIIIIKKCCFEKNNRLYSEEINSQLTEFNELAIN